MKGAYLLVMDLPDAASIQVGTHRVVNFQKGCYVYVGSALNGLEQRIQRHLRKEKKVHWHIDYLLPFMIISEIYMKESNRKEECTIARMFERFCTGIQGFGCTDCACNSHLFTGAPQDIQRIIDSLEMKSYLHYANP